MKRTLPLAAALAALAAAPPAARAEKSHCDEHSQAAASAAGSDPAAGSAAAEPAAAEAPAPSRGAAISFPDAPLLDQRGNAVKLATGAIGDRIVVMDFVFTTCTTICPLLSGIMAGVQDGLGADEADVALLSVTVDPARDTPARLEAYAKKWHAGPRWTFLTGERDAVKRVLEAAGAYTANFSAHPPMVLVGDGRTGRWVRLNGFPKRTQVLAEVKALRDARAAAVRTAQAGGTNP